MDKHHKREHFAFPEPTSLPQCGGKICYVKKAMALRRKNEIMNSHRKKGRPKEMEAYYCCWCGFWHLRTARWIRYEQTYGDGDFQ